jgi:hypothetical protein
MVAISGGLLISVVVFALARDATRFYQRESRVGDATLGVIIGFERLRADIARAGFLSTPNIQDDPLFCGGPAALSRQPGELGRLASIRLIVDDPAAVNNPVFQQNDISPDAIVLAGNYQSADVFPMWGVSGGGGQPPTVYLQPGIGPLARAGYLTLANRTDQQTLLDGLFPARRALRIVDEAGRIQFGIIAGTVAGGEPAIQLGSTSVLSFRGAAATACGVKDQELGVVNVVNFIRYELRDLSQSPGRYAALFNGPGRTPFDANRRELVRAELFADTTDTIDPTTLEVVVEHAVDLKFGVTVAGPALNALQTFPPGNASVQTTASDVSTNDSKPQWIRAIRVRLSARSTVPDREADVAQPDSEGEVAQDAPGVAAGLYRIRVGSGEEPFARVRTLQADVALPNQSGVIW